jgi:hypothetical protein
MIAWLFLNTLGMRSINFPEQPMAGQVTIGRSVYKSGAGIDRTLLGDRVTLGTWFDGRIRRAVDTLTWVSPELASRWFGYLAERDGWSDDIIAKHWVNARHRLDRNLTFIVRLSAFPKLDPLEFGSDAPAKPETLKGVRFRLAYTPKRSNGVSAPIVASTAGTCAAMLEKYEPADVTTRQFYSLTDLAPLFLDDGETDRLDDGIPLGDYYGAVYLAVFPITPEMRRTTSFELTLQLNTKREHAAFNLFYLPASKETPRSEDD